MEKVKGTAIWSYRDEILSYYVMSEVKQNLRSLFFISKKINSGKRNKLDVFVVYQRVVLCWLLNKSQNDDDDDVTLRPTRWPKMFNDCLSALERSAALPLLFPS